MHFKHALGTFQSGKSEKNEIQKYPSRPFVVNKHLLSHDTEFTTIIVARL